MGCAGSKEHPDPAPIEADAVQAHLTEPSEGRAARVASLDAAPPQQSQQAKDQAEAQSHPPPPTPQSQGQSQGEQLPLPEAEEAVAVSVLSDSVSPLPSDTVSPLPTPLVQSPAPPLFIPHSPANPNP